MAPPAYDTSGIQHFSIPSFTFSTGETLPIQIAYRSFNPTAKRTILVSTCYKGLINETCNFTNIFQDEHVLVVALLGNGESSSPSNDANFPAKSYYEDDINAQYALLQNLKISSLYAVIGFSMGGQIAYYWAVMQKSFSTGTPFVENIISICSSAKTSSHNIAFLEGPVIALTSSVDYATYKSKDVLPKVGLRAFGRTYAAWISSSEWFRQELWTKTGQGSLDEWLDAQGKGYDDWAPEDLVLLARKWQACDVGKVGGGGDWQQALREVKSKVLVVPCRTDQYFTPDQSEREVACLEKGELAVIESIWGHLAGVGVLNPSDTEWMEQRILKFLAHA